MKIAIHINHRAYYNKNHPCLHILNENEVANEENRIFVHLLLESNGVYNDIIMYIIYNSGQRF